jgi:phage head maturation protease
MDTTLPDLDIVRTTLVGCELRGAGDGSQREGLGLLDIRWSPFNAWYRISSFWEGDFLERTVPGTFKRTIGAHRAATRDDAHNIKTLFNHGMDFHIGDKLLGDIEELSEDADSPRSTVWLWDTSYNRDLLPGFRSGAYGASFMFRVVKDEWNEEPGVSEHNPDGLPERTIREARVFEAGPVTWPASPTATAGMRCASATDAYYEHLARRDPARVDGLRSRLLALRSAGPAHSTPPDPGPATAPPADPAPRHSEGPRLRAERARRLREARLVSLS